MPKLKAPGVRLLSASGLFEMRKAKRENQKDDYKAPLLIDRKNKALIELIRATVIEAFKAKNFPQKSIDRFMEKKFMIDEKVGIILDPREFAEPNADLHDYYLITTKGGQRQPEIITKDGFYQRNDGLCFPKGKPRDEIELDDDDVQVYSGAWVNAVINVVAWESKEQPGDIGCSMYLLGLKFRKNDEPFVFGETAEESDYDDEDEDEEPASKQRDRRNLAD